LQRAFFAVYGYEVNVMRLLVNLCVMGSLLGAVGAAHADYDLVVKKNCLACHAVEKRKYGPNFKEISQKYSSQANAVEVLAKKIRSGGAGVWGEDMMPPQPQVSESEAQAIARYVLSLK
jgi:cytochrome c